MSTLCTCPRDTIELTLNSSLRKQLPFPDQSFDLVRISCLTFAIPYDRWSDLLSEVERVLVVGGRLELIDDHIFFPYTARPASSSSPMTSTTPSRSEFSLSLDDTQTFHTGRTPSMIASPEPDDSQSSRDLELLFQSMLNTRYGIHLCPSDFLQEELEEKFGFGREMFVGHLTLDTPPIASDGQVVNKIMLYPNTPITLPARKGRGWELDVALRHPKILLSLKKSMTEYAVEIAVAEDSEDDAGAAEPVDEGEVMEALWEYDQSLATRFSPPPASSTYDSATTTSAALLDTVREDDEPDLQMSTIPSNGNGNGRRERSRASLTPDNQQEMWEYQL